MKNITLEEFQDLPNTSQYDIIFEQGIFMESRYEEEREYSLYAVNRFFVELVYETEENLIVGKQSFIDGEALDFYISLNPETLLE